MDKIANYCKQCTCYLNKNEKTRIAGNLRNRIYKALHSNSKSAKTMELLGCEIEFFKKWIESQFTPEMNWKNIHIDHHVPCAAFDLSKEDEPKICFHWKNMQPLLAKDNLMKGCKRDYISECQQKIFADNYEKLQEIGCY